jgi:NADPH:quinone reductase-like Zn-dependent oxidoreductase
LKNEEGESSDVSLAKTTKCSSQNQVPKEVEIMAQKKFLVTGATGDTGGYTVEQLLERGHAVRALGHREDDRSKRLQELGTEVVIGDLLNFE